MVGYILVASQLFLPIAVILALALWGLSRSSAAVGSLFQIIGAVVVIVLFCWLAIVYLSYFPIFLKNTSVAFGLPYLRNSYLLTFSMGLIGSLAYFHIIFLYVFPRIPGINEHAIKSIDFVWYGGGALLATLTIMDLQLEEAQTEFQRGVAEFDRRMEVFEQAQAPADEACQTLEEESIENPDVRLSAFSVMFAQEICAKLPNFDPTKEVLFECAPDGPMFNPDATKPPENLEEAIDAVRQLCVAYVNVDAMKYSMQEKQTDVELNEFFNPLVALYWYIYFSIFVGLKMTKTSLEIWEKRKSRSTN